jgi:hypothetical protein
VREVSEETTSISQTTVTQTIHTLTNSSWTVYTSNDGTTSTNSSTTSLKYVKSAKSILKFYINGVRISNSAITYNVSTGTVTYNSVANNSYMIKTGDRLQIDYYY